MPVDARALASLLSGFCLTLTAGSAPGAAAVDNNGESELWTRSDDQRPADQLRLNLYGRPLTVGGEYEIEPLYRNDFAFGARDDDLFRVDQKLEIELIYNWSEHLIVYLEGLAKMRADLYEEGESEAHDAWLERGETWVDFSNIADSPWSLQIGRQNFHDKREWWWDKDLDAVRVRYERGAWYAEAALAEEQGRISTLEPLPEKDSDIVRALGRVKWEWARKQRLELFALRHDDRSGTPAVSTELDESREDESDARLAWYGARALGRIKMKPLGRLHYWLDYGRVTGREKQIAFSDAGAGRIQVDDVVKRDVEGWGLDLGVTLEPPARHVPRLTLAYAEGSGDDDPADGTDHAFRQTGIHNNNGKFRGESRFRYYGEVLRPQLSNLRIGTVAAGWPIGGNSSIEFVFHRYRQVEAADSVRDARLRIDPLGEDTDLGDEFDVILSLEEWKHLELEFVAGTFEAGKAFGDEAGERANLAIVKIDYNF